MQICQESPSSRREDGLSGKLSARAAVTAAGAASRTGGMGPRTSVASGLHSRASVRRARSSAHDGRTMFGGASGAHGRGAAVMMRARAQGRSMRTGRRRRPEGRSMGHRRGNVAIDGPRVMPVMRADDKGRKHGNDEGRGGVDGSYSDASRVDAAGRNGHSSSYGRPAIVIGAAGKGRAEQGGTKQKGETLHGGLLAER